MKFATSVFWFLFFSITSICYCFAHFYLENFDHSTQPIRDRSGYDNLISEKQISNEQGRIIKKEYLRVLESLLVEQTTIKIKKIIDSYFEITSPHYSELKDDHIGENKQLNAWSDWNQNGIFENVNGITRSQIFKNSTEK